MAGNSDPSTFTLDRRIKYALSIIAASVFFILALMRGSDLISRKELILLDREKRAANLAAILSQYLHEVFAVTDSSLRQISLLSTRIGGPAASNEEWGAILRSARAGLSGVGSISVVDQNGIIRHSTLDFLIGQSRRDDYIFQRLHSESKDILVASKPFRTLTKNPQLVIPLGRRLTTLKGNFDGAVVATVVPIELQHFFQSVDVGKSGMVSVFHPDGIILIQKPSLSNPMGKTAHGNPIYESARQGAGWGTIRATIAAGGPLMLNAFRVTEEPKLIVAVSLNQNEILSDWRREVLISITAFLVFGFIVAFILAFLFRQIKARSVAEHALQRESLLREVERAEARAAHEIADVRAELAKELERKNKELEAFSYSVSHDLRAPLRGVDGFSKLLQERHADQLDEAGQSYLERVRAGANRMGELIDDLLQLSNLSRINLHIRTVDLSRIANEVIMNLQTLHEKRKVVTLIHEGLHAFGDSKLLRIVLENLLGNAWKFTANVTEARIEFGSCDTINGPAFFVRDNGAGFDMKHADRLFHPFQRLHPEAEFPGTGIGLATVSRVIDRHSGHIWAESAAGHGATFFFTLPTKSS